MVLTVFGSCNRVYLFKSILSYISAGHLRRLHGGGDEGSECSHSRANQRSAKARSQTTTLTTGRQGEASDPAEPAGSAAAPPPSPAACIIDAGRCALRCSVRTAQLHLLCIPSLFVSCFFNLLTLFTPKMWRHTLIFYTRDNKRRPP